MRAGQADDLKRKLTLVSGARVGPTDAPRFFWAITDGWVVPTEQVYNTGNLNAVPLIIGNNEDEIELFFRRPPPTKLTDYHEYVRRWFKEAEAKVLARYPASSDPEAQVAFKKLLGDTEFNYAAAATAIAMSRWQKVFRYHFTRDRGTRKVATPADEVPYIFGKLGLPFFGLPAGSVEPVDEKLSEVMMGAWVRFAATGDPNGGDMEWPVYTRANDAHWSSAMWSRQAADFIRRPSRSGTAFSAGDSV